MSIVPFNNSEKQRYKRLLEQFGRATLHAIFPDSFEAYFISLELTDSQGNTEQFFTFPVQPSQITEISTNITNVKKTGSGVTTISTDTFVPKDIEIKGNFGRQLRFNLGNNLITGSSILFKRDQMNSLSIVKSAFSSVANTGYGSVKALENILDEADQLDDNNRPKRLFLYNPILGNNYLVKKKSWIHSQNLSENMIPSYTVQLTAVAPLESVVDQGKDELGELLSNEKLDSGIKKISKKIDSILNEA
jgi:hypothetical protein